MTTARQIFIFRGLSLPWRVLDTAFVHDEANSLQHSSPPKVGESTFPKHIMTVDDVVRLIILIVEYWTYLE